MKRICFAACLAAAILLSGCALAGTGGAPTSTPPLPESPVERVQVYLIALEDAGNTGEQVGCGDSLVPVEVEAPNTGDPLRAAYQSLLGIDEQYYGQSGLYNSLYQSDLTVEEVSLQDGEATVHLTGQLRLGGECDTPRAEAQLTATAMQFQQFNTVTVFINDMPLEEALSLR